MQRKYVYIIVFLLAIIVSVSYYYVDQSLNRVNVNDLVATNNLESNIFDDTEFTDVFDSASIKSPMIIKNYQNNDVKLTYSYMLKIDGIYGAYKYEKDGKEGYIVFSANGETTFELSSNETLTIFDIPNGGEYYIEQMTRNSDDYITKINDVESYNFTGEVLLETHIDIENNTRPNYVPPVEENPIDDGQEEVTKPVKPIQNEEEKNPVTGDGVYLLIAAWVIMMIVLVSLVKVKVKRFE